MTVAAAHEFLTLLQKGAAGRNMRLVGVAIFWDRWPPTVLALQVQSRAFRRSESPRNIRGQDLLE